MTQGNPGPICPSGCGFLFHSFCLCQWGVPLCLSMLQCIPDGCLFCKTGDIDRTITIHLDHRIRLCEIGTGTACHQNGGNSKLFIQQTDPIGKRRDGLCFCCYHLLHQFIPDHKVGSAGILIYEECLCPCFNGFCHACRLGGAAAGIFCIKCCGIFPIGQMIDKERNVYLLDASAVFCPQFHGRIFCDHILSAIPLSVRIYSTLQCFQKCRFSMIAASDDDCNAFWNAHTGKGSFVRQLQGHCQRGRRHKRYRLLHRSAGHP